MTKDLVCRIVSEPSGISFFLRELADRIDRDGLQPDDNAIGHTFADGVSTPINFDYEYDDWDTDTGYSLLDLDLEHPD